MGQCWGLLAVGLGVPGVGSVVWGRAWEWVLSLNDAIEALDPTFPACNAAAEGNGILQGLPWGMGGSVQLGQAGAS